MFCALWGLYWSMEAFLDPCSIVKYGRCFYDDSHVILYQKKIKKLAKKNLNFFFDFFL